MWFERKCGEGYVLFSYPNQEDNQVYYHIQEWRKFNVHSGSTNEENINICNKDKEDALKLQLNRKVFFTYLTNESISSTRKVHDNQLEEEEVTIGTTSLKILSNNTMIVIL